MDPKSLNPFKNKMMFINFALYFVAASWFSAWVVIPMVCINILGYVEGSVYDILRSRGLLPDG